MFKSDGRMLNLYYREIQNALPCQNADKRKIMERIRVSVSAYREEHPEAEFAQIRERFGEPSVIAEACMNEMGVKDLLCVVRTRCKILTTVIGAVVAVVLLFAVGIGLIVRENHIHSAGTLEEYIIVVDAPSTEGGPAE